MTSVSLEFAEGAIDPDYRHLVIIRLLDRDRTRLLPAQPGASSVLSKSRDQTNIGSKRGIVYDGEVRNE